MYLYYLNKQTNRQTDKERNGEKERPTKKEKSSTPSKHLYTDF